MHGPATRQPSLANGAMRLGESGGKVKEWWRQGRGHCRGAEVPVVIVGRRRVSREVTVSHGEVKGGSD